MSAALPGVTTQVGDARRLPAADDSVDAVLMLGPLYHLTDPADRTSALCEAMRVLRPGGVLIAAAISRYLSVLETGTRGTLDDTLTLAVRDVIATGDYDGHVGFMRTPGTPPRSYALNSKRPVSPTSRSTASRAPLGRPSTTPAPATGRSCQQHYGVRNCWNKTPASSTPAHTCWR